MGRYNSGGGHSFKCLKIDKGKYEISWIVDYYYDNSKLCHPKRFRRVTTIKQESLSALA